jgi:hypothetical protein
VLAGTGAGDANAFFKRKQHGTVEACYRKVVVPAQYTWVAKQVMLKPGWTEVVTTPARYKVKHERVLVTPKRTVWHTTPAQYTTVTENVVVKPASTVWVKKRSWRGEVMCKVHMPAETAQVSRKVVVTPAGKVAEVQPAVYTVVEKPVMIAPARSHTVKHPPVYGTVKERVLVQPASATWVQTDAGC